MHGGGGFSIKFTEPSWSRGLTCGPSRTEEHHTDWFKHVRTIIKLLIVAVLLNAVARCGVVAMAYFRFQDEAQQTLVFGARLSPEALSKEILVRAKDHEVPLRPADLKVVRQGIRTVADVAYVQPVELFPSYIYALPLSFRVDAVSY